MSDSSVRVLLVEDREDQAELLRIRLKRFDPGLEILEATSGEEGLEVLERTQVDAVILDYDLPGMNGLEILGAISERGYRMPVIVVTGQGSERVAVQAMKQGAYDYIIKEKGYERLVPRVVRTAIESYRLKEQLRTSEERYRLLFENATEGIFVEDLDKNRLVETNLAAQRMTGLSRAELQSRSLEDLVPAEQKSIIQRLYEVALERGQAMSNELNLLQADGNEIAVDVSLTTVEHGGKPVLLMIARDVTDKRRLEQQILLSKRRLQTLFDGITDFILVVDPNYKLVMVNRKLAEWRGLPPEKLVGRNCREGVVGIAGFCEQCPVPETFRTGRSQFREWSKGDRTYHIWTYPLFGLDGRVEMVVEHAKDVTEQRRLEKQLIKAEKLATIGLLASGIAHELRNPLNIIEAARYALELELAQKAPESRNKLEIIRKNVQRASKIINNLLEFSRHSRYEREQIDVNRLIDSTLSLIEKELSSKSIEVVRDYSEIPPALFSLDSLKQVFLNIILNAIQAMPNGGRLTISTRLSAESGDIEVAFSDTGHGIPEEALPHVFSPFYTTKPAGEGTGLGMYISHTIIRREGGDISVESELGHGTTFTVRLPAAEGGTAVRQVGPQTRNLEEPRRETTGALQ